MIGVSTYHYLQVSHSFVDMFIYSFSAISSTRNDGAEQQNEDVPTASVEVATAAMSTMCTASHNDVTDAVFRNFARIGENTLAKSEVSRFLHIVIDMTLRLRDTDEVSYDTTRAVRLAGATARVMFDAIDRDHDGSVDRDEFETWLGKALGAKKLAPPPDDNTTPAGTASHVEVEAMKRALERLNLMVAITTMVRYVEAPIYSSDLDYIDACIYIYIFFPYTVPTAE